MKHTLKYTSLGHPDIDKEHEEIIAQLNEINNLISKRTEDATLIKLLDGLIERTVRHYAIEERLMEAVTDYPDRDLHILEHRLVIQSITHYRHKLQQEIIDYQIAFKNSVNMWLEHIFKYDKSLIEQYKNEYPNETLLDD
jgi:hemerythrin